MRTSHRVAPTGQPRSNNRPDARADPRVAGAIALQRVAGNRAATQVLARRKWKKGEATEYVRVHAPERGEALAAYFNRLQKEEGLAAIDYKDNKEEFDEAATAAIAKTKPAAAQTSGGGQGRGGGRNASPPPPAAAAPVQAAFNFEQFAAAQGYERDKEREVFKNYGTGGGSHTPKGGVWIKGDFAIAEDKDQHAPGGVMKGFMSTSTGWIYAGTYDREGNRVERQAGSRGGGKGPQRIA